MLFHNLIYSFLHINIKVAGIAYCHIGVNAKLIEIASDYIKAKAMYGAYAGIV